MHSVTPFTLWTRVVDMCDVVLRAEGWKTYLSALLGRAPRYGVVFAPRLAAMSGEDVRDLLRDLAEQPVETIARLAHVAAAAFDPVQRAAYLEAAGVVQVVHGAPWACGEGNLNDHVAQVAELSASYVAWGGVRLDDAEAALAEAHRVTAELGMSGLSTIPFFDGVDPSDSSLDRLWDFAQAEGLPVWIHSGQNFSSSPIDISGPRAIDRLATKFPELRIVLGHGGWPWILDAIALMQRHPNLYLEFSSHHPRTMSEPGSGWEPLFLHGARALKSRVLFGSTSWTHAGGLESVVEAALDLDLDDAVKDRWMASNALALLSPTGVAA